MFNTFETPIRDVTKSVWRPKVDQKRCKLAQQLVPVHEKFGSNCAGQSRASKGISLESDVISPKFDDRIPWTGTNRNLVFASLWQCLPQFEPKSNTHY